MILLEKNNRFWQTHLFLISANKTGRYKAKMQLKTWKEMHKAWHSYSLYAPIRSLIDGHFLKQKTHRDIWISYSLNIWKNKFLYEKINGSVRWNKHS